MKTRVLLVVALIGLLTSSVQAWNSSGHMIVASMAYRDLPADKKKAVMDLLSHHPAFEKWARTYQETDEELEFGEFLIMKAATWPDDIRRKGGDTAQFDHPDWHFIDYPLRPTEFPDEPGPKPEDDVLFGIKQCQELLSDEGAERELKAVSLSWLIHLVGDIHQPLHCASLFNDMFAEGDRGGNGFWVKPAKSGGKLHAFWDGLLGNSTNPRQIHNSASALRKNHSKRSMEAALNEIDPVAWSKETRKLAIESAYLKGELQGTTKRGDALNTPREYAGNCKTVAERQVALAAYRLSNLINATPINEVTDEDR